MYGLYKMFYHIRILHSYNNVFINYYLINFIKTSHLFRALRAHRPAEESKNKIKV